MLSGTADAEAHAEDAPRLKGFDAQAVTLPGAQVLQLLCELKSEVAAALLPPAAHPTIPGVVGWLVYVCKDSPWGAFRLAQTRIECRSGTRPRGFLVSGVIDNPAAAAALESGWGYRLRSGEIDFRRGFDGVDVEVRLQGAPVLALGLREPTGLPPDVVQFVSGLHPAHTPSGYRLLQVDVRHEVTRAERGEPRTLLFDGEAWGDARIVPFYGISAAICLADVTLQPLRFVTRPGELAFTGTEAIGAD